MMIVAFWRDQVLEWRLLSPGDTVGGEVFRSFLNETLYPEIRRRRLARPAILMDNAPAHRSHVVQDYIRQRRWTLIRQDPYSPDENPCDYDGIERIKRLMRGRHFSNIIQLTDAVITSVNAINRNRNFQGILNYRTQMQRIIDCDGDYVNHPE